MEQIKKAVDRAKANSPADRLRPLDEIPNVESVAPAQTIDPFPASTTRAPSPNPSLQDEKLNWAALEQNRIVSHNPADQRSKAFDMLRTQVVQSMDEKSQHFLAVTSPTTGCGKTVTAINLALSIARQPERPVLLVDMDLQRPKVSTYLGLNCRHGLQGILEGRGELRDSLTRATFDGCHLLVLPVEAPTPRSSELIGSRTMSKLFQDLRRDFKSHIVVFDMPPLLQSEQVIASLPKMDCALLVAAVGVSTARQIKECRNYLRSSEIVRVVLNKSNEAEAHHYY